jgi:hypothetical protein
MVLKLNEEHLISFNFIADCSPYVSSPPRTPLGVLNGLLATPNSASSRGTPSGTPRTPAEERVLKKVTVPTVYQSHRIHFVRGKG